MEINFKITNKFLLVLMISGLLFLVYTQNADAAPIRKNIEKKDSIEIQDIEKIVNTSDTGHYNKVIISGVHSNPFENYQQDLVEPFDAMNTFYIRRARLKFIYEAISGVKFVLSNDFSKSENTIKDAYAELSLPKSRNISLLAGKFKRPDYDFKYGSSEKEMLERTREFKEIYPDKRDIGLKLLYNGIALPLKLQVAFLNGNFDKTQKKDVDNRKDIMALASYSWDIPNTGTSIDFGTNFYTGGLKVKSTRYVSDRDVTIDSIALGAYLNRNWISYAFQIYSDFLGGTIIKYELLKGKYVYDVDSSTPASKANPYKVRDFSGFNIYFIKKIGLKTQFIARYDYFDPNTKVSGNAAWEEIYFKTLAFAFEHFLNDNINLGISYVVPENEINNDSRTDFKDNIFTARVQIKF